MSRSGQQEKGDKRLVIPCRFFIAGQCNKGSRCRFYHPTGNEYEFMRPPTPPLPSSKFNLEYRAIRNQGHTSNNTGQYSPTGPNYKNSYQQPPPNHLRYQRFPTPNNNRYVYTSNNSNGNGAGGGGYSAEQLTQHHSAELQNGQNNYHYNNHSNVYKGQMGNKGKPPLATRSLADLGLDEGKEENSTNPDDCLLDHINWNDFLAPGKSLPEAKYYEREEKNNSVTTKLSSIAISDDKIDPTPINASTSKDYAQRFLKKNGQSAGDGLVEVIFDGTAEFNKKNKSLPATASNATEDDQEDLEKTADNRPLTAKEELQQKMLKIAKDMVTEDHFESPEEIKKRERLDIQEELKKQEEAYNLQASQQVMEENSELEQYFGYTFNETMLAEDLFEEDPK